MNEMERPLNSHAENPYAGWTDGERMEEFVETGNPVYLTPDIARIMKVSPDVMRQVPGATPADIEAAQVYFEAQKNFEEQYQAELLLKFGLHESQVNSLSSSEKVQRYFDACNQEYSEEIDEIDTEEIRDFALEKLISFLLENPDNLEAILAAIRYRETNAIFDVKVLKYVYSHVYHRFIDLSHDRDISRDDEAKGHRYAEILNKFVWICAGVIDHKASEKDPEANYLGIRLLEDFAERVGITEDAHIDMDDYVPFEITPGNLAVFYNPTQTLFVLPAQDMSPHTLRDFRKFSGKIRENYTGQYFAQHIQLEVPRELEDVSEEVVNLGYPIESLLSEVAHAESDVRDFVWLLRSDIRPVVEEEFGFRISELSLKEQFFFLNYLKHTNVGGAETMQHFTSVFGTDALRTFLAIEKEGEEFGHALIGFGINNEKQAIDVFASYAGLLDEAETLEAYIRSELDCSVVDCQAVSQAARMRLLNDAHEYLKTAIVSNDPTLQKGLEVRVREAKKLSAAFQAAIAAEQVGTVEQFASFKNEVVPSAAIDEMLRQELLDIYRLNYEAFNYPPEAIRELLGSLEEKLQQDNVRAYVRKAAGKVLAFGLVSDDLKTKTSYVSGLNANPELKGTKQGITVLGEIVADNKARGWTTTGEASPSNFRHYGELPLPHGWVATAAKPDDLKAEAYMVDMAVFPKASFSSKSLAVPEVIRAAGARPETLQMQNGIYYWYTLDDSKTPPFSDGTEALGITRSLSITHEGKNQYLFVLEPIPHTATAPQTQIAA